MKALFVKPTTVGTFIVKDVTFESTDTYLKALAVLASERYPDYLILHPEYLCPITLDCTAQFYSEHTQRKVPCDIFGTTYEQLQQKLADHCQGYEIGDIFCRIIRSESGRFGRFMDIHHFNKRISEAGVNYADGTLLNDSSKYWSK